MSKTPYMKFYTSDFLGDTLHLNAKEVGQYCLLLFAMWNSGGGILNDRPTLRRICRGYPSRRVLDFFTLEDGKLQNERLFCELKLIEKRAEIGAKGGAAKAANALKNNNSALPNGLPKAYPHSHSHSHRRKKDRKEVPVGEDFEKFWLSYPRKIGKAAAKIAFAKAIEKVPLETLLAGVKTIDKSDLKFIAHAATWLNQERWTDEDETRPIYTPTAGAKKSFAEQNEKHTQDRLARITRELIEERKMPR